MKKSAASLVSSLLLCALCPLMLLHSAYVTEGAKNGLLLWYSFVVPALFPFMVLSGLIVSGGGIGILTAPFHLVLGPLLGLSKPGVYVLLAGFFCGCPMGAKTCADFLREGRITENEARFLLAVCNHPSPMFLLGYVWPLFSGQASLFSVVFSMYGPLLLIVPLAMVLYPGRQREGNRPGGHLRPAPSQTSDEAILNAMGILCKIGGYLMIFSIAIVFLKNSRALPPLLRLFLIGAMEMTTGIKELAAALPFPFSGAASMAALAFGGFSGLFQTKAVLAVPDAPEIPAADEKKAGLSIRHYFFWKLLHGALSFFFFFLTVRRFPGFPLLFP